jgi:hypothetical protein
MSDMLPTDKQSRSLDPSMAPPRRSARLKSARTEPPSLVSVLHDRREEARSGGVRPG